MEHLWEMSSVVARASANSSLFEQKNERNLAAKKGIYLTHAIVRLTDRDKAEIPFSSAIRIV